MTSIASRGDCNIMLTGGHTASSLYVHWAKTTTLPMERLNIFFGDERCVPDDHTDSNYAMTKKTLFPSGVPAGCTISKIEANKPDKEAVAKRYDELLPDVIDILLLGLGADGHIASIFPNSSASRSKYKKVMYAEGPIAPKKRITITPKVITEARSIYLLATGKEKGCILREALNAPNEIERLPVCLTLDGTWLIDKNAAYSIFLQADT